jgi:hypothetical protein
MLGFGARSDCQLRSGSRAPSGLGFNEPFLLHAGDIFRICPISKSPPLATSFRLAVDIGSFERPSV